MSGKRRSGILSLVLLAAMSSAGSVCAGQDDLQVLPAPVAVSQYYPCSQCHTSAGTVQGDASGTFHGTVSVEGHAEQDYGCFDCHDRGDMDRLILFNGGRVDITYSSELCGQCHSTNFRLWQSGLHGKVTGKWNGQRSIVSCAGCHDPHGPGYASHSPAPPPTPPEKTLRWRR